MELYFLRHAIAADFAPDGSGDAGRPLTEEGILKMREAARGIKRLGVQLDVLLSSPLLRARQTAEIVAETLKIDVQIEDRLACGCTLIDLQPILEAHGSAQRIMVVGHEPDFSTLIGDLTGGSMVMMKKGALARVDLDVNDERDGELIWLLQPRVLRVIGG
jgi:phosphohistidine phosphatase